MNEEDEFEDANIRNAPKTRVISEKRKKMRTGVQVTLASLSSLRKMKMKRSSSPLRETKIRIEETGVKMKSERKAIVNRWTVEDQEKFANGFKKLEKDFTSIQKEYVKKFIS